MNTDADPTKSSYDYRRFRVLFVDDELQAREYFDEMFSDDFSILTAADAEAAWQVIEEYGDQIAVMICDQRMPGQQGVELLGRAKLRYPGMVRILTTAYSDMDSAIAAVNTGGAFRYLTKPWNLNEVRGTLLRAMEFYLVRLDRDRLLGEKLHVLQRLIVMDRVRGLAALAAAMRCRLRHPLAALKAYVARAPLHRWREVNLEDAPRMDIITLARCEGENLVHAVQEVLWSTLPWGLEEWDSRLDRYWEDLRMEDIVRDVAERFRMETGYHRISVQVDTLPPPPHVRGNPDLLCRLLEILIDRLQMLSGEDAPISVRLQSLAGGEPERGLSLFVCTEGRAWDWPQMLPLFAAVLPTSSWRLGLDRDLLPAHFLAAHHAATLHVHPEAPLGPGFSVEFALGGLAAPDDELDADWFDAAFSILEQYEDLDF